MLLKDKIVAIVGGGPGGLTLARLLQLKGVTVNVYERDADRFARQQGATLDLHEDAGLKALAAAGLMSEFEVRYRPGADKMRLADAAGQLHFDEHARPDAPPAPGHYRPEIDRGPLRDILIASLQPDTMSWNAHFRALTPQGQGWMLHFQNGTQAYADLVIAADGANSRIRPLLSDVQPVYSGMAILEGNIYAAAQNAPAMHALVKGGKVMAFGNGNSLILSAKGDGSLSFYTGSREAEDWVTASGIDFNDRRQVFGWFKTRFADWAPMWDELFATDALYFVPRPMYHFPPDQSWEPQANLTMIGDAAHRVPPYAGEGVNMAMLDALELSGHLTENNHTRLKAAIGSFEREMCRRAGEVTLMTLENTELLHSPAALQAMIALMEGK